MTERAMSLHIISARVINLDAVLVSSEELGGCDLSMFLLMQVSWEGAAEMATKVAKKRTTMMLMETFIASVFSCCFYEDKKCIDSLYIVKYNMRDLKLVSH